ncbi:P-loop containing nucleoside triphosphate hydrolase protein [Diaporthe sp. PMI_573]|nr:P-loop containing nucleoside triphosphate hydrolase protein [Diaporthaceae sp. PMI_573]
MLPYHPDTDLEKQPGGGEGAGSHHLLRNTTVHIISWSGITVTVTDRETKQPKTLLDNVQGYVEAGEVLALMGPSGCGKTTLLNVLAGRQPTTTTKGPKATGTVRVNGTTPQPTTLRRLSRFVEQEDALIGSLTVRETLSFASRLSTGGLSAAERADRVDDVLSALGLRGQAGTLIGTPVRRGVSGGQRRRTGVGAQLMTCPRVLFLDEPTSGLDSAASLEVVRYLRAVARRDNLIIVASIHQPSTAAFNMFDKLLLLGSGQTHFFGPLSAVGPYYESVRRSLPLHVNPAEFLLDLVNVDFVGGEGGGDGGEEDAAAKAKERLATMRHAWMRSPLAEQLASIVGYCEPQQQGSDMDLVDAAEERNRPGFASLVLTLLHRSFIKSYRDVIAYGVRMAMYFGLAVMMGTVWVRLKTEQEYIQPYINAIFFGSAFMSFMAVAYVPAWLEDRLQYVKESSTGLYSAAHLVLSNFLIGTVPLFMIALGFSAISYYLSNFNPSASAFFTWVMWVFLDLLAAESLVVVIGSLAPNFVVALALVAFANGLWMCVNGFMLQPTILNVFYKYVFSYWDYQKYVFEGMMVNEFSGRSYGCGGGCRCMYETDLAAECRIDGQGVLDQFGYRDGYLGKNVGIMIGIIAGYRLVAWLVLMWKR